MTALVSSPTRPNCAALWLAALTAFATLCLYLQPLGWPILLQDDFQILSQSWTWERTRAGLWVPQNEHAMPLGRLLTFGLDKLAGGPSGLPLAAALVGPVALLLGLPLVYRFVGRELGHPLYGVVALILLGVTSVYQQAVFWFAASFSIFALDMLLLGLLAAQHYRWTGHAPWLAVCALCCALAPCWFASGILAGPLCCLYLLLPERGSWPGTGQTWLRFALLRATPLLGSGLFLAVSLPLTAQTINHLPHYQDQHTDALGGVSAGHGPAADGQGADRMSAAGRDRYQRRGRPVVADDQFAGVAGVGGRVVGLAMRRMAGCCCSVSV